MGEGYATGKAGDDRGGSPTSEAAPRPRKRPLDGPEWALIGAMLLVLLTLTGLLLRNAPFVPQYLSRLPVLAYFTQTLLAIMLAAAAIVGLAAIFFAFGESHASNHGPQVAEEMEVEGWSV